MRDGESHHVGLLLVMRNQGKPHQMVPFQSVERL
jgi:hypothetical protein